MLQDGTNSILNTDKSANDILNDFKNLVDMCCKKFAPDKVKICEVPPLTKSKQGYKRNCRKVQYNAVSVDFCDIKKPKGFNVIKINKQIKDIGN